MTNEERFNTLTHLAGVVLTIATAWFVLSPGYAAGPEHAFGVTSFAVGMVVMYSASTLYHWCPQGRAKQCLRKVDHIGIYVMIAASYSPILIGVVGGVLGWTVFGLMWAATLAGACYKILAMGRWPALSLALYLAMGWSVVFIAKPVIEGLSSASLVCLLVEGLLYTGGTYFFYHDKRPLFHGVWHLFVLGGSVAHWLAVYFIYLS